MNGNECLVDTNILIYLQKGIQNFDTLLQDRTVYISLITEIEMLGVAGLTPAQKKQIRHVIEDCIVVGLDHSVKEETIRLKQLYKLKIPDAIVAATASILRIPLITADADFKRIKSVPIIIVEPY